MISIIIPVYNKAKYIRETLESILSQSYQNFEIIVINDGSTDESEKIIKSFLPNPQIVYRLQKNAGPANARNNGMELAKGKFLLFLDADDLLTPKYFEKTLEKFRKNTNLDIVLTDAKIFGQTQDTWINRDFTLWQILNANRILSTAALIKKSALDKIGNFDLKIPGLEDWDFWLRAKMAGLKFGFINEKLFLYRKLPVSQNTKDNKKYVQIASYLRKKYGSYYSLNIFRLFSKYKVGHRETLLFWLHNIFYRLIPNYLKVVLSKWRKESKILLLLILASLILGGCQSTQLNPKQVCFDKICFDVELAQEPGQKITGLMEHTELISNAGMLFIYDRPRQIGIWMKNMDFPIDIIWLDENLNVVHSFKSAPPCQSNQHCQTYENQTPAQYVLEINAGLIDKYDLELGNTAEFKFLN